MGPADTPRIPACQIPYECSTPALERVAMVRWAAGLGAVTAESLAICSGVTLTSARARLSFAQRSGLLTRHRPLTDRPALYTVTRGGLRTLAGRGLDPCRVSPAVASHLIECARVAAVLERCYPDHRVVGERELRRDEREQGRLLASAELGRGPRGERLRHRPDLALWPDDSGQPIAIEVELTVKAPERLEEICRAWARSHCVAGVLYLARPDVQRALARAIGRADAEERVLVIALDGLPQLHG